MEIHGIYRFVEFKNISLVLLGENYDKNVTKYNRYDDKNIVFSLLELFNEDSDTKYNLYVEDLLMSKERNLIDQYSFSPLSKISDLFRYGELYFILKFTKENNDCNSIVYACGTNIDNINSFIQLYYNIKPVTVLICKYDENILLEK